jgi:hypothetical protein
VIRDLGGLLNGVDGDEGGIGVAHGDVRFAQSDFDGFAERGAAYHFHMSSGDESEFTEAGEARFGSEKPVNDGEGADWEVCEGGS